MAKMWAGVTAGKTDSLADDFNSSIRFDSRMARQDITGSIAHAAMLAAKGIISEADCEALTEGLAGILEAGSASGISSRRNRIRCPAARCSVSPLPVPW